VALISGGGSGHEPMHCGFVGMGMLDGACPGEVFTSPTPDQMYECAKAVAADEGGLFIVKNYTGDVMNFETAIEMVHGDGIKVQNILIDDDVAVKDSLYTAGRRGVGTTVLVEKLQAALTRAGQDLEQLKNQAAQKVGDTEAAIFDAQKMFLDDPALLDAVQDRILGRQCNAESAWLASIDAMVREYRKLEAPYLREQAADVIDVGRRVLRQLIDQDLPALEFAQPAILFAEELTPSDTIQLNPDKVLGICTVLGGGTSHSAIVAKALGIPTVVGLDCDMLSLPENGIIALDGTLGLVWPHPTKAQLAKFKTRRDAWQNRQQQAKALAQAPASTMGRHPKTIKIVANSVPHDTKTILDYGAEGVGLFRTEFLFLGRLQAPSEEEQLLAYTQMANTMQTRPLVIRTLDIGADKTVPYLDMAPENNPFLGLRGIRFCLAHLDIFKTQLRAILKLDVQVFWRGTAKNLNYTFI